MRHKNILIAGVLALCCVVSVETARACDDHKASAASTEKAGCTYSQTASMSGGACAAKAGIVSIFKDAPGTKTEYVVVDGGVALVVTAASEQYVPVVQNAVIQRIDDMKVRTTKTSGGSCAMKSEHASIVKTSSSSSSCAAKAEQASVVVKGSSDHCAAAKTEQASTVQKASSGAGCCAAKGSAAKVSMVQSISNEECPDWMKVLCSADMKVEKTAKGVMITWTSPKKDKVMVDQLRAAGEKFHADVAQL